MHTFLEVQLWVKINFSLGLLTDTSKTPHPTLKICYQNEGKSRNNTAQKQKKELKMKKKTMNITKYNKEINWKRVMRKAEAKFTSPIGQPVKRSTQKKRSNDKAFGGV